LLQNIANDEDKDILGVHSRGRVKYDENHKIQHTSLIESININCENYKKIFDIKSYVERTSIFSLSKTREKSRSFMLMASRGCPIHCTFCAAHTVHGRRSRWRDIKNIKDEIMMLYNDYGVTKIYLADDNLTPKTKFLELLSMMTTIDIPNFKVEITNLNVNHTDFDIIDAIKKAGMEFITLAIETGSREMQKKIKKFCNLDKARELVRYSQKEGLSVRCSYIIGFPAETIAQMNDTIEFALEIKADWTGIFIATPIPGTEMYDEFVSLGYIEDSPKSWRAMTIRERTFDTAETTAQELEEIAYAANLKINFINNTHIANKRYEEAISIFSNIAELYPFHVFAYDVLRRAYLYKGDIKEERRMLDKMKCLVRTNPKSKDMIKKYGYLLDDSIRCEFDFIL
jgi:radical SAM superfamily enzyme YgiQ (UPF0313 family)